MVFKIMKIVLMLVIVTSFFMSCQSVKDFYSENRELIQDIIQIILDTLFENITIPAVSTPSGDNSGIKVQSAIPIPGNVIDSSIYKEEIARVFSNPAFWESVNSRVEILLKSRGVK